MQETWFNPWVGKIPWRRKWQATPVFLTEESHGQRGWVGYSPWGHKELDMTEQLNHHCHVTSRYVHRAILESFTTLKKKSI